MNILAIECIINEQRTLFIIFSFPRIVTRLILNRSPLLIYTSKASEIVEAYSQLKAWPSEKP